MLTPRFKLRLFNHDSLMKSPELKGSCLESLGLKIPGLKFGVEKFRGCNVLQPPSRRQVPSIIIIPGTPKVDKLNPVFKPKISVEINDGNLEITVEDTPKGQEISIEILLVHIQFLQKIKEIVFPISALASI